ncbi:MAG: lipopolysaccharide biosynthesis protein [Bacteroidetes bacterium]|nr:lipopolysaccharide biosynthesis protein [Bacteroidota bacterium]
MASPLKKLASDTAIYGITHSLGRFLNFLLVPLYTSVFSLEQYGVVSVYYALVAFAIVVLTYGFETAFFNFSRNQDPTVVFSTGIRSILATSALFVVVGILSRQQIANFLEYPDQSHFVVLFVFILALDAINALPFAWLRFSNHSARFGIIRLAGIALNIGFNLLFLIAIPRMIAAGQTVSWYSSDFGIGYIFLSNLLSSGLTTLMLLPQFSGIRNGFDRDLWKTMMQYARPLIWVGLAGIVNETLDRILLKKMLPVELADSEIAVYSAFYKISIVITLAVQSFRFAAEPFFFEHSKSDQPQKTYARIMHYFVVVVAFLFLATSVFAEPLGRLFIRRPEYFDHPQWRALVPILLLANLFLGIVFNLNIWYKLKNLTGIGRNISLIGAAITIVLNLLLIPIIGILGSAITTLITYGTMAVVSYSVGQKHYPIPYNLKIIGFYIVFAIILYGLNQWMQAWLGTIILPGIVVVIAYSAVVYFLEGPPKKG